MFAAPLKLHHKLPEDTLRCLRLRMTRGCWAELGSQRNGCIPRGGNACFAAQLLPLPSGLVRQRPCGVPRKTPYFSNIHCTKIES